MPRQILNDGLHDTICFRNTKIVKTYTKKTPIGGILLISTIRSSHEGCLLSFVFSVLLGWLYGWKIFSL